MPFIEFVILTLFTTSDLFIYSCGFNDTIWVLLLYSNAAPLLGAVIVTYVTFPYVTGLHYILFYARAF